MIRKIQNEIRKVEVNQNRENQGVVRNHRIPVAAQLVAVEKQRSPTLLERQPNEKRRVTNHHRNESRKQDLVGIRILERSLKDFPAVPLTLD